MNIDIHMNGQFFNRWSIDDIKDFVFPGDKIEDPQEYEQAFEEYVSAKERLVKLKYQYFLEHTAPLLKTLKEVQVFVVFESKMNAFAEDFTEEETL